MHGHPFGRLGLALCLALGLALAPQQGTAEPLAEPSVRLKLRAAAGELAKTGEAGLVWRARDALLALGDDALELERLTRGWEKTAASAKPGRTTRATAAKKLRRALDSVSPALASAPEDRRAELARTLVELDSDDAAANAALGRTRDADGEWLTGEEQAWKAGASRAARLEIDVQTGKSDSKVLAQLCGGGNFARAHGVEVHSRLPVERLERIVRQALRAAALSNALLRDVLEVPPVIHAGFVLLDTDEHYRPALEEAHAAKGIGEQEYRDQLDHDIRSFTDSRGWRTSRWRSEAAFEALVLWELDDLLLGPNAQPCASVGHLNWVCLEFLGSPIPTVAWRENVGGTPSADRTITRKDEELLRKSLWRSANQSLWGCRSWMIQAVREKRDPPWARSMVDQPGLIADENLLKSTLVCEMLQQEGRLWEVVQETRGKKPPGPAFETTLGESLPEFDERWRRWLAPTSKLGVVQELGREAPADAPAETPFAAALAALNRARSAALEGQAPEIPVVALDLDLSRAAELHARYLTLNPASKTAWPAAHEENAGSPGFTPAGSVAGGHAVIAFDGDPARSVQGWLDTFFHRLPLLNPGLFGVGFGTSEEVVVLDIASLVLEPWKDHVVVWPLDGARDVPRRMTPELPNPVPDADMAEFGYPISVQLFFREQRARIGLELELFAGDPEPRNAVECHRIAPEAPLQPELAPENVWALIPKRPLAKKTTYTARARWAGETKVWTFTTGG